MKKLVAIHTGPYTHLDHLAPLCFLLNIPLIVTESHHLNLAQTFYPMIETHHVPLQKLSLDRLAEFDGLIECGKFWAMELKPLLSLFFQKDIRILFAPHGYSDKETLLDQPIEQDIALTYGPHHEVEANHTIEMGNIRLWFYNRHKEHFDRLARQHLTLDPNKQTFLYAPTWTTKASTSSFPTLGKQLIASLSNECNLIVKLHPLLQEQYEGALENFPAIYSLLNLIDGYIGDTSSIGYDMLAFEKPMWFLKGNGPLTEVGQPYEGADSLCDRQLELLDKKKRLYSQTFANTPDEDALRERIGALLL